jgi:hypothetical protein
MPSALDLFHMGPSEQLLYYWQRTFFLEPFIMACQCATIVVYIINHRKDPVRKFFFFYTIISLSLFLLVPIVYFLDLPHKVWRPVDIMLNLCFQISEFICFSYFFSKILSIKKIKILLTLFSAPVALLSLLSVINFFTQTDNFYLTNKFIDAVSCCVYFSMIIGCLTFFYQLFKLDVLPSLAQKPSFWIVTGVLFYSIYSLPFLLIAQLIRISNNHLFFVLYTGHYITFVLVFIMLIKAFRCKKSLTTS